MKKIAWRPSKVYQKDGNTYRITVCASLDDDCHNKHCDFSITADIRENGKEYMGGCCHEEIVKQFPELKKFIPLHICAHEGTPMYPVENGIYHIKESSKEKAMEYLRITENELCQLFLAKDDKLYFRYLLFSLGIVERWKKEADEFIAFLEEKTGNKWENPYTPEEERFRLLPLNDEERALVEKRLAEGYYTTEAVAERDKQAKIAARQAEYDKVNQRYAETELKARQERDIKLCIIDHDLPVENVIYYDFKNEVVFNWMDWDKKGAITREQFDAFVASVDYSKLPEGIKFLFGKQDKK